MIKCIIVLFSTIFLFPVANAGSTALDPKLEAAYKRFKAAISCVPTISSGHRTPKKNEAVGGAKKSYHLKGQALDLVFKECLTSLSDLAKIAGLYFNGIIVYKRHIHVDIREMPYYGTGHYKKGLR